MSTYADRLASFTSAWPHASPKPQDLARAGLSYMPTKEHPDNVICKLCNTELFDWLPADDPMLEHHRCSNSCIRLGAKGEPPIMFVQDAVAPPPKHSQASLKDPQEASPQKASPQKALPQPLPPRLTESSSSSSPPSKTMTFDERLATFASWPHDIPDAEDIADAGFIHQPTSKKLDNVICKRCKIQLCDWKPADDPRQKHHAHSESCICFPSKSLPAMMLFVPDYTAILQEVAQTSSLKVRKRSSLQASQKAPPSSSVIFVQDAMALSPKDAQAPAQADQPIAPKPLPKDIGFLDPSLQHDFLDLCLFHDAYAFCDRIERCRSEYGEAAILALLPRCLRGEALTWFRSQSECQDLAVCIEALKARFPQSSQEAPSQTAPQSIGSACQAPDYHHCKLCNASFSSMARLMRHTQENVCNRPSCRHCDMVFSSKNQLHQHLREECRKQAHRRSSSKSSLSPSSRSSSRSSSSPSSASSPTCSPKSSPSPPPTPRTPSKLGAKLDSAPQASSSPSPPPRYQAISPSPPSYLTIKDLSARYAGPPCLNVDDLFRMFGGSSATTKSSTIPTSARSSTPAASKHPPIRHRGRCHAEKGDGSSQAAKHLKPNKTPKTTKTTKTKQQNQKQKIDFVRTSLQPTPYKSVLPLQRSRSVSCPMVTPSSPSSFHASSAPKLTIPQCIRSQMLTTDMHWLPMPHI